MLPVALLLPLDGEVLLSEPEEPLEPDEPVEPVEPDEPEPLVEPLPATEPLNEPEPEAEPEAERSVLPEDDVGEDELLAYGCEAPEDELLVSELVLLELPAELRALEGLLLVEPVEARELLLPPAAELVSAAEELLGFWLLVLELSEESCDEVLPLVELGVEELFA